jgi:hypothetical protein
MQMPLSDEQMDAMAAHQDQKPLSDDQMDALGSVAKNPSSLAMAAKAVDSVTGAPTRTAIFAMQNGQNPLKAGLKQFGNMTDEAPTGKDIALRAGISDIPVQSVDAKTPTAMDNPFRQPGNQISPADIAGTTIDIAANPVNLVGPALKTIGPAAEALSDFANDRALKAAGAMTKDFRTINAKGMQDALGGYLLDNKIVTPLSTVGNIANKLSEAKQTAGQTIGHILDTTDATINAPKISARDIALKLAEDPEIHALQTVPGSERTANQVNNYLNTLYQNGDSLTLRDAQKLRQGIDSSIDFNKAVPEMKGAQPYLYKMRSEISNAMNDAVNSLPSSSEVDGLKNANLAYNKIATLDKIAQNRLGALSSNEKFNLGDKIAAGVGASIGSGAGPAGEFAGATVAGGISKAGRAFGNSLSATGAKTASNLLQGLQKAPNIIGPAASASIQQNRGNQ